jgi:hypothetical protein
MVSAEWSNLIQSSQCCKYKRTLRLKYQLLYTLSLLTHDCYNQYPWYMASMSWNSLFQ